MIVAARTVIPGNSVQQDYLILPFILRYTKCGTRDTENMYFVEKKF